MRKQFLALFAVLALLMGTFLTACSGTQAEKIVDQTETDPVPKTETAASSAPDTASLPAAAEETTSEINALINQSKPAANISQDTVKSAQPSVDKINMNESVKGST